MNIFSSMPNTLNSPRARRTVAIIAYIGDIGLHATKNATISDFLENWYLETSGYFIGTAQNLGSILFSKKSYRWLKMFTFFHFDELEKKKEKKQKNESPLFSSVFMLSTRFLFLIKDNKVDFI